LFANPIILNKPQIKEETLGVILTLLIWGFLEVFGKLFLKVYHVLNLGMLCEIANELTELEMIFFSAVKRCLL